MEPSNIAGNNFGGEQSLRALLEIEKTMMERLANRRPLPELLDTLTLAIEHMAPGVACAILQLDDSAAGFHIASAPHLPAPFLHALEQADLQHASGSGAAAIRTGESVIVTDIGHDPRWDELRAPALEAGFQACWAVPMTSPQREVLGALEVYLRQPRAPQGFELEVVQHVAFLAARTIGRKELDDTLVENEQMFRAIFENEQDSMAIIDPQLQTFVTVNPAFERLFGYSREEAVGMAITEVNTQPVRAQALMQELAVSTKPPGLWRRRLKRKDGTTFLAECMACFVPVRGHRLVCIMARDISDQQRAEKALSLAAKVYESMTEGIVVSAWPAPVLAVNSALTTMTGYSREELIGQDGGYFYADNKLWHRIASKCLRNNVPGDAEVTLRRKNGSLFACLLSLHFARHEPSEPLTLIAVYKDLSTRRQTENRLLFLSNHDILTRLPNRFLFYKRLDQAIASAQHATRRFAVFFIDLDRFKNINDTFGHPTGDALLQLVSDRLYECIRKSDLIARLGGDEFAILAESVSDMASATELAEQVMAALSLPFHVEGQELFVAASIGISVFPQDGPTAEKLIKSADVAMYRAKGSGKNNYQFFAADMSTAPLEHMMLENALRHALQRAEFQLYYQPKVHASTARIYGMEALLRWNHPDLGIIGPSRFIPLAEEMGLIRAIGEWALQEACRQNAEWQHAGYAGLVVSVNLSSNQLQNDIVATVSDTLNQTGLAACWLELELTESTVMRAPEQSVLVLHALRDMGVQIAIDDFGTGYSSLSYLKRFPINTLKIDQSFVRDIIEDPNDAAITDAVIALARALKMGVIAEGVETAEQLRFLRDNGCDSYQGFLFSRPLPAAEFQKLLPRPLIQHRPGAGGSGP
ncbi:MAG TPA: EAL domain-containing protein [Burkholderiaceae bacterium]|nr:EAL domain-containing protein [Burkholderiaceae bacterium]